MKLTLTQREAVEGWLFKATIYFLDVNTEFTEAEKQAIEANNWTTSSLCNAPVDDGYRSKWPIGYFSRQPTTYFRFNTPAMRFQFATELSTNFEKLKTALKQIGEVSEPLDRQKLNKLVNALERESKGSLQARLPLLDELASLCVQGLEAIDIEKAVGNLVWKDAELAAQLRELSELGTRFDDGLDLTSISHGTCDNMAYLHMVAAMVGRVDRDYHKAVRHNKRRLRLTRDPGSLSDKVLGGMMADAVRIDAAAGADMVIEFSNLCEERPEWEVLTPRLRRLLN